MTKSQPKSLKPRLCFVGPMVGRQPGHVTTQGEILSRLFQARGYSVTSVSTRRNRYLRLADIIMTLVRKRCEVDVQCLQVFGGPSFVVEDIASWLGRRFGQSIIMFLRGGAMPEFMARHPQWTRRVLARADALIAPSEFLARAVVPYGFEAQVIPNVIDLSEYPYRHRHAVSPRLLWMRTFHPVWNPLMAVRVFARLRAALPEASLVMAGQNKGQEADVQRLAEELGLDGAVRFSGFLDMSGKVREGNVADIFLNTPCVDNMPVAVLEACALGLPVVTTAVGGIPDLLTHGETGLLVPSDNDEAMVQALQRLLSEPDLAARLSANGRSLAERSASERVCPQLERVFDAVMKRPDRDRRASS